MKHHLKRLGISCLVAVAIMAVAGVASASAEQSRFCKVNETPCSSANSYGIGTQLTFTGKTPIRWVGYYAGFPVSSSECLNGLTFKTTTTGGSTQPVEASMSGGNLVCEGPIVMPEVPKMRFNWISGTMNASVITTGFTFSFQESGCTYKGEEIKTGVTLTGGNPAMLTFKEAPVTPSPEICGSSGKLSGEFEVSAPKPLYVSNG